jgi:pilus assembly protein CpaC
MNKLLGLLLIPAFLSAVEAPEAITIVTGRGQLLRFESDVKQVVASEPKIADVVVVSPREVMVNAKEPGKATVIVWQNGEPVRFDVDVVADTSDLENFRKMLAEQIPGSKIEITGKGETIVLTGSVAEAKQIKLAGSLAETRAKNVVNLLTSPPAADPRQIVLEVKFASLDRTKLSQVGLNMFSNNPKMVGETTTGQFSSPRFTQLAPTGSGQGVNFSSLLNLFLYRPDLNIGATIAMLQENDVLEMLAEPNLITVEGKTASFLAGGSFPFPVISTTPTGGSNAPVVTVQFKPFGVKLDFTPTVTPAGAIDLLVAPEVSALDYADAVTLQGFMIPALSTRRAETEVVLKDGESFAIAGLIDKQVQKTVDKIPGIGNIPIIGELFSSHNTKRTDTELLVVITARFVKPLSPEEKAKLPNFPIGLLPSVPDPKPKKGSAADFVGPRGHQVPN